MMYNIHILHKIHKYNINQCSSNHISASTTPFYNTQDLILGESKLLASRWGIIPYLMTSKETRIEFSTIIVFQSNLNNGIYGSLPELSLNKQTM